MKEVYEPAEDSNLMLNVIISKQLKGDVLDMGTGSGILALECLKKKCVKNVVAVDINPKAVQNLKKMIKKKKLTKLKAIKSDLFAKLDSLKFDVILFNPPYLPEDEREPQDWHKTAVTGGKHGWELIQRFAGKANNHLKKEGKIYILFSSLTKKEKVEEIFKNFLFDFKRIIKQKLDFEELYIYELKKNKLLKELEKKSITNVQRFAKGHHSVVYTGEYKRKKVAIKVMNKERVNKEAQILKELNKNNIGPTFIAKGQDYFIMDYIEGKRIFDFFENASPLEIKKIIKNVLEQCYKLDTLGYTKEEMHHPYKHIIIDKNLKVTMIDFERCKKSRSPKNVTQFIQCITSTTTQILLRNKSIGFSSINLRKLAQIYKENPDLKNFKRILSEI